MQRTANCGPLLGGPGIHSTLRSSLPLPFFSTAAMQALITTVYACPSPAPITTTLTPPPADLPDPHSYLQFKNQNGIHPRTCSQRRSLYLYPGLNNVFLSAPSKSKLHVTYTPIYGGAPEIPSTLSTAWSLQIYLESLHRPKSGLESFFTHRPRRPLTPHEIHTLHPTRLDPLPLSV
ncbi:hypothetical protein DFH08DRAFT_965454 [Mycena albidolilacea]|uniref:Uncharacterized protein n=1 Tax=Mycena albidolilacea TaxID=1033008 RepID=A0AAD6ZQP5_9AGAR|nr:hypothetical protein DFH08DRAFT_965454 [Mycena albidolilacea]